MSPFYAPDPSYTAEQQLLAAAAQNQKGSRSHRDERKRSKSTAAKPVAATAEPPAKKSATVGAAAAGTQFSVVMTFTHLNFTTLFNALVRFICTHKERVNIRNMAGGVTIKDWPYSIRMVGLITESSLLFREH